MVEDHYRLKRLEMALAATRFLLKSTRICSENMPKTTRFATLRTSTRHRLSEGHRAHLSRALGYHGLGNRATETRPERGSRITGLNTNPRPRVGQLRVDPRRPYKAPPYYL